MELMLDEQGHAVLRNGKPVYKHTDGKEIEFDAGQAFAKIGQLTGENTAYKTRFTEAETKLKTFEGIADPSAAIKALETLASLDQKKLIDVGEVEKVKAEISKAFQAQIDTAVSERDAFKAQLYDEKIGGSFARSKMIAEKLAIPSDLVQARFGNQFKIEDGKAVAYDSNGNKIYSRSKPGELADFEEALELLVDQYPHKDSILKGTVLPGSGAGGGEGGNTGNSIDLSKLPPMERLTKARELGLATKS